MLDKQEVFLRDLLLTSKDGDWGPDEPPGVPVHIIRGTDFPHVRLGQVSTVPLRYLVEDSLNRRNLQPNDILIETAGGSKDRPTGRTLLVTKAILAKFSEPVTCASFARFLRIDPKLADPRYVFWYLQHLHTSGAMWKHQVQHTGVARFQFTRFSEIEPIPLPHKRMQEKVSELLGVLDEKIAANDRLAATLDGLSQALFSQHFESTGEGVDWSRGTLAELCKTQYGYTASSVDKPVGPRFLRVKDINKRNWIEWPDVPYCEIPPGMLDRYRLHRGDIVVARMADPGKSAIVEDDQESVFASYLVRLKTESLAHSYFVWGFLKSERYQDYVAASKSGSVQSNMNAKVIVGASVDIPPVELMQKHLLAIDPLRQKLLAVLGESRTLVELRDVLLPELMSGRLRLKDAEDVIANAV